MSKTNVSERRVLQHELGIAEQPMLTGHTVGFATAVEDPETGETGMTILPEGDGYAEVAAAWQMDSAPEDDLQQASNAAEVLFGEATAAKGHPTHFYIREGGGSIIRFGTLPNAGFEYAVGVQPRFAPGVLHCTED
jgi:hypothetical protein